MQQSQWKLLQELNTKNLSDIQEKIILRHINEVIKISSIEGYLKEYCFLTDHRFITTLNENEKKMFHIVKSFYVVRHLLVHGSSIKQAMIPHKTSGWWFRLDEDDKEYQSFINTLKENMEIKISNRNLNLKTLLLINQVTDLLIEAIVTMANKLHVDNSLKYIKENIFEKK